VSCRLQAVSDSAGEGVKSLSGGVERCRGPECVKPVKPGSVYCTEACIHAHTQESLQLLRQERSKNASSRSKFEVCALSSVYVRYVTSHFTVSHFAVSHFAISHFAVSYFTISQFLGVGLGV